jgi:hypothetical protein
MEGHPQGRLAGFSGKSFDKMQTIYIKLIGKNNGGD